MEPRGEMHESPILKPRENQSAPGMPDAVNHPYLLLAGELHLSLRDLTAEMVHFTSQLHYLIVGARRLIELFGQVEILVVELRVVLGQLV